MRAGVLSAGGRWTVREVPDPHCGPGELLVRTELTAICGSDVHQARECVDGSPPGYPGHESVGTVLRSEHQRFATGDRALCVPPAALAAGFAELQVVPARYALPLPPDSPDDIVAAQQLGTAVFAMKRFWPRHLGPPAGRTAAVLGAGPAGLAFVRLLLAEGFRLVVVSDTSANRLDVAERLGATTRALAPDQDALQIALNTTDGAGVDLVVEAAGRDSTRHQAMRMVALDGRIGLFGLEEHPGLSSWPFQEVFRRRPTIDMVWDAQNEAALQSFATARDLLLADPGPRLISHRLPLAQIADAFELAADPSLGTLKVAVTFTD